MLREELGEYRRICDVYRELHERYEKRKALVLKLLEEAAEARRRAMLELGKASRITRRLTAYQRRELGFSLPGELSGSGRAQGGAVSGKSEKTRNLAPSPPPLFPETFQNRRELRECEYRIVSMIDDLKNKLLRLSILEMRCREILLSLGKVMKAYDYEYRRAIKSIYPFAVISRIYKALRRFWGRAYFTGRDLAELAVIGRLGADIIKMAESPIL